MASRWIKPALSGFALCAAVAGFSLWRAKPWSTLGAEGVAHAEITGLYKREAYDRLPQMCERFVRDFPESGKIESIHTIKGEALVHLGKWKDVGAFYRELEAKFPKSRYMDRYVFFQALSFFMDANFQEASPLLDKFLKNHPNSELVESAYYYVAMSNFLQGRYKETLASCRNHLAKFPDGRFAGDMQYRLSFIDFNDKEVDQNDKIIRDLSNFLKTHPSNLSNGSMLCLMADTWKKKMDKAKDDKVKECEDSAIDCYIKAVWTESPDDVVQYALDSATTILRGRKDWTSIADLHGKFLTERPNSALALISATWVAKAYARDGRAAEAATLLADILKNRIADPSVEQVESLIDELVKSIVPRKKAKDPDVDALDKQLTYLLTKTVEGRENATTAARIYYARARLAEMVKRRDRADLYMKGIATTNAKNPSVLSPVLLAYSGDILLKEGDLDGAEVMFRRLSDRYPDSMHADAAPLGFARLALARKTPEEALRQFETIIAMPGARNIREASVGKLRSLVELDRLDPATSLAIEMLDDPKFRGEPSAETHLILVRIYRKQAAQQEGDAQREWLWKAHATCQKVCSAYQGFPALCAEAHWLAYEILMDLKEDEKAKEMLENLRKHPRL